MAQNADVNYDAAVRALKSGNYAYAAREFGGFIQADPHSTRAKQAAVLQLLAQGELQLRARRFEEAITTFAEFSLRYPDSPWKFDAILGEALAYFNAGNLEHVEALLHSSKGTVLSHVRPVGTDPLIVRSYLLLAEAHLALGQFDAAEAVLDLLTDPPQSPQIAWEETYLRTRLYLMNRRWPEALQSADRMLARVQILNSTRNIAESVRLKAQVLRRLGRLDDVLVTLEANLSDTTPAPVRRLAMLDTIDLLILRGQYDKAAERLELFLTVFESDPASDLALLTIGELKFRQYLSLPAEQRQGSGVLDAAIQSFKRLLAAHPSSDHQGNAYLNLGWCYWAANQAEPDEAKRFAAESAFQQALELLPPSADQAVARFKLGDCLFQGGKHGEAVDHYQTVVNDYKDFPEVDESLVDPALYQIVRAWLELDRPDQVDQAAKAVATLLSRGSGSPYSDYASLLLGEGWNRKQRNEEAKALFLSIISANPDFVLLPEVKLALAHSHEQAAEWDAAIELYDQWVVGYTNHPSLARAEYDRAMAYDQFGKEQRSFQIMTNFLTQFPTNSLLSLAQNWIADYYYRRSEFDQAEKHYQLVYLNTNRPASELTYQARFMAGRCAYFRRGIKDALDYFTDLVEILVMDTNRPAGLLDEVWISLGDTIMEEPETDSSQGAAKWNVASEAFKRVPITNALGPLALGRVGDCYLQLAALDARFYTNTFNAYSNVMQLPQADLSTRSLAEIGLAKVISKQAELAVDERRDQLLATAINHYLNVWTGRNRRTTAEVEDFYRLEAAREVLEVFESNGEWERAYQLYAQIIEEYPALSDRFRRNLEQAKARLDSTASEP